MAKPVDKIYQVNEKVSISVKIAGEGEPVVFLHGIGGLTWDPFLEELSNHYKVYAPHLPGTADSTGIESINDLWDLILCYYDLFDKMGLESAHVIGHSLGGMIAVELAATDQSRVKQLVAIAPFGLFKEEHPIPDIFAMLPNEMTELIVNDKSSELAKELNHIPEDINVRLEKTIHRIQNMQAAAKFLWPIPDKGLKRRIHRIKSPTLLIWGKEDRLIPFMYANEFHHLIENSEVEVIENASHNVTLEQTTKVLTSIKNFLKTKSASLS